MCSRFLLIGAAIACLFLQASGMERNQEKGRVVRAKKKEPIDYVRLSLAQTKKTTQPQSQKKQYAHDVSQKDFTSEENQLLQVLVDVYGLKSVIKYDKQYTHLIPSRFRSISRDEALCEHKALIPLLHQCAEKVTDNDRFSVVAKRAAELSNIEHEQG